MESLKSKNRFEFIKWAQNLLRECREKGLINTETTNWAIDWAVAVMCHESSYGKKVWHGNLIGYHYYKGHEWEWYTARESSTRTIRKYRKFSSYEECVVSFFYLVEKSSLVGYIKARKYYKTDPLTFMEKFSMQYCPSDSVRHFGSVHSIFQNINNPDVLHFPMKEGTRGQHVYHLQEWINKMIREHNLKLKLLEVDGVFGLKTNRTVLFIVRPYSLS